MLASLVLVASFTAAQVAVEGDAEARATVVLRLLDEGYRVVPSGRDVSGPF